MAVRNAMFMFEVVVAEVTSYVESRHLVIKSEFSDVFALELRDPKTMVIVIPEPPPPPPEPTGKKKKKKPKPKKKKKGAVELPPPKPDIQSGQSVLFTSNAEFLLQNMLKYPMDVSLWSKEKHFCSIGSTAVPWDPAFIYFLKLIMNCQEPPPVSVRDDYNIFEEGTAKIIAKIGMKVTLRYLTDRVTSSFRSLSEDPNVRKFLYTGMNSKVTSFICTMKTKDEDFEKNCNKIPNNYIKDRPLLPAPIRYADYKNAPGVNILNTEALECCQKKSDKPPDSKYKSPETAPDIDFICDYVRKIITSCNDTMRMLTPRPTIRPRVRATDIDRLCYCRETSWPPSKLAERFRREVQGPPCPICINKGKPQGGPLSGTFDLACFRGPCGSTECKVAREVREFIQEQAAEDNEVFNFSDLIGPCGSRSCTIAERIADFLQHRGPFEHTTHIKEGLSTQCDCQKQMQDSLLTKDYDDAESNDSDEQQDGAGHKKETTKVYQVYYFTVEYDKTPTGSPSSSVKSASSPDKSAPSPQSTAPSSSVTPKPSFKMSSNPSEKSESTNYCDPHCPKKKNLGCSKSLCFSDNKGLTPVRITESEKCVDSRCPPKQDSPPDSHVVIPLSAIRNPCCVKDCKVEQDIKKFIVENMGNKANDYDNPCYCDCICDLKFSKRTTYCAVCGGYECLGDDVRALPDFQKPHPCPVYNKLYNKKYIKTKSPWPEEAPEKPLDSQSTRSARLVASRGALPVKRGALTVNAEPPEKDKKKKPTTKEKNKDSSKKVSKFTANNATVTAQENINRHLVCYTSIIPVPKNMGWNWKADDIPGLKYRPDWKPGAAHKRLVSRYRTIREPLESILAKKKLKAFMMSKRKKLVNKPTVTITKKNGEYVVTMDVLRKYSKERLVHQYPFDENKQPVSYTIGKTEEEKAKIQKQRDRIERRKMRRKSRLIQSAFRDKCQEICVKAYNQAIGLLPVPNPNYPDCPCDLETVNPYPPPVDSCSCSESETISSSDTDNDEWTVEFYAPAARWDPQVKPPPRPVDAQSQYSYLDFRVKLYDKSGNLIPRFFKGPDGKQVCADLGGFWSDDKNWLEINKDGFVGPDNRWIPLNFIGPDGLNYTYEDGNFIDSSGKQYKIGVDGYIDVNGKWAWYGRARTKGSRSDATVSTLHSKNARVIESKKVGPSTRTKEVPGKKAVVAVTTQASGHGAKVARGKPKPIVSPPDRGPLKIITLPPGVRAKPHRCQLYMAKVGKFDRDKNVHQEPNLISPSKYVDTRNVDKYNEIMQDLNMCEDFVEMQSPHTANRACMTTTANETPTRQYSFYGTDLRPGRTPAQEPRIQMPTHRRLRPIDSMKIYGMDSLRTQKQPSFSSRSGLQTQTTTSSYLKH